MPHRTLQTRPQDEYNIPGHILNYSASPLEQEPAVDPIRHSPVLLKEVLELLRPQPESFYIDATIGLGGHAEAILETSGSRGELLGIDRDEEALFIASQRLARFRGRYMSSMRILRTLKKLLGSEVLLNAMEF